ncbi:MAG: NAD(P)-dependent oxidoreductase [Desulfobacterales bacterium]|nr:NAD(P)-dependent oxidoreductase [Desulfobacterales bacterium]
MEKPKKRLLVTGASGFLGYRVCMEAQKNWQVFGTHHAKPVAVAGVEALGLDLTNHDDLAHSVKQVRPHAVIHTAAVSQPEDCQAHPASSRAINVSATANLATLCARDKIPFVFTSTDLVFDGLNAPYAETDPVSPVNEYGRQKVEAEEAIRRICPAAAICRMPLMFGHAPGTGSGFLGWMIRALEKGEPIRLFTDEYRTMVDTVSAARGLILFTEKSGGTYHLGGRRRISRHDMGLALLQRGPWDPSLLIRASVYDSTGLAPRSPDVSLVSESAYALGYRPTDFDRALDEGIRSRGIVVRNPDP